MRFANQRRVVAKLLAIVLITPIALEGGSNWASETTINQTDRDQLQQRGQELRAALQQTYQELLRTKRLNGHRTDITQSVLPYISVGMSFRDAETILHNAGFTIEKPDLGPGTRNLWILRSRGRLSASRLDPRSSVSMRFCTETSVFSAFVFDEHHNSVYLPHGWADRADSEP